jgi:hypothetical protein
LQFEDIQQYRTLHEEVYIHDESFQKTKQRHYDRERERVIRLKSDSYHLNFEETKFFNNIKLRKHGLTLTKKVLFVCLFFQKEQKNKKTNGYDLSQMFSVKWYKFFWKILFCLKWDYWRNQILKQTIILQHILKTTTRMRQRKRKSEWGWENRTLGDVLLHEFEFCPNNIEQRDPDEGFCAIPRSDHAFLYFLYVHMTYETKISKKLKPITRVETHIYSHEKEREAIPFE